MGCDCCIHIPADARLDDISRVMGIIAGCDKEKYLIGHGESWSVRVKGVDVQLPGHSCLAMCANIIINHPTVDGEDSHYVMFHGEPSASHGRYRLLMPRSTPFWLAMGLRLISFFGGTLDCNDCDSVKVNFRRPKPRKWNDPDDGVPWQKFQEDMWDVKPIVRADLLKMRKYAAYDIGIDVKPKPPAPREETVDQAAVDEAVAAAVRQVVGEVAG